MGRTARKMVRCCQRAISTAQQREPLTPQAEAETSFLLYIAGASWLDGHDATLDSSGIAPQLSRSVLALIRKQAQRLQVQSDELVTMRASLDERKIIDQAKGWLMQQHGYSE